MATYNTSVTSSIKYIPFNLSASEGLTVTVDNPLQGSSYITLESYRDQNGFYPAGTPKNTQGTFTLSGISNIVQDDYKAGFVVQPGGGTITFNNTNYVSGSNLQVRGTEYHPFYNTLLDRWPNAAAAYSLRLLNSYYGGPAVRVRRSIDNEETNIGFNPVELDTATLETWVTNPGTALPADYGDGAAAAYSLRYVSSTYSGPVIRVRRDSDNNEANFTPSEITDGTLEAWVGVGNNGFVTTWYDQSGNGHNATQATAANQPKIVNSGSVVTENGKPSMEFDGSNDYLTLAQITPNTEWTVFGIGAKKDPSGIMTFLGSNNGAINSTLGHSFDGRGYLNNGTQYRQTNSTYTNTNQTLWSGVVASSLPQAIYRNSTLLSTTPVNATITQGFSMIGRYNDWYTTASLAEILLYQSDQSSNRTDIESNINNYYSIFPFNAYVTTWYDQSGNGNNATQTTAANQPQIVSSGSVILENSKPSLLFDGLNDRFGFTEINGVTGLSLITVSNYSIISNSIQIYLGSDIILAYTGGFIKDMSIGARQNKSQIYYEDGTSKFIEGLSISTNTQYLQFGYVSTNGAGISTNGNLTTGTAGLNNSIVRAIAQDLNSVYFNGVIQEAIIYPSDQSSNRTGIETNINSHYKIY